MNATALILTLLTATAVSAQDPTTGYAPVNGLKMYYEVHGRGDPGDMRPRSESRLAILPDTTHITLMNRLDVIVPMVNDFLDARPPKHSRVPGAEGVSR